jgi:hypothetical protein
MAIKSNDSFGFNPVFFTGTVEDRRPSKDKTVIGHLKVRIDNWHTQDKGKLPTEQLPYAAVCTPNSGGISGMGRSPNGYMKNSRVFGFFLDAEKQYPIILGSIPHIQQKKGPTKGKIKGA